VNEEPYPEIAGTDGRPLAVVAAYATRSEANERSLVIAATQTPLWILRWEGQFALCVPPSRAAEMTVELQRFEAEQTERAAAPTAEAAARAPHSTLSLYAYAWVLIGFYAMERHGPSWWLDRGTASSRAIMAGQWWRAFTALTLHADIEHIGGNIALGLVYAAFLLPILGAGWTWFFIVLAGGIGNWLNAWGHSDVDHLSIGASTGVFGALGILVAAQCAMRAMALRTVKAREFLLPIGAGLGFLAWLGVGDQQTDYMAHFFGLIAGAPFGIAGVWLRLGTRTPRMAQWVLAWSALAVLAGCWVLAAGHP
jgi:membrane associated rhomboid family serine protease